MRTILTDDLRAIAAAQLKEDRNRHGKGTTASIENEDRVPAEVENNDEIVLKCMLRKKDLNSMHHT